ncbi:MAG TPA: hypothetical protein DD490_00340 [Acidobacteria bacterium]|nr:hypothetical protein [Acidobacteriota bacterium]
MKFKTDENVPLEAAELLRAAGHDALSVLDQGLQGWIDPGIASICQAEERILVTLDVDFADVRAYPPHDFPGFLVLRLKRQDTPAVLQALERAVRLFRFEEPAGRLWIIEDERVRIRGE